MRKKLKPKLCSWRNHSYQSKSNVGAALEHIGTEIYMLYFFVIKEEQWATTMREWSRSKNAFR